MGLALFVVNLQNILLIFFSAAAVEAHTGPVCGLECEYLTSDDYENMLWTSFAEIPGENLPLGQDMWKTIPILIYAKSKKKPFTFVLFSRSATARFATGPLWSKEDHGDLPPDVFSVFVAHVLVCFSREVRLRSLLFSDSSYSNG